jgi:hypothetical protein
MSTLETKTVSAACAGRMLGLGKAKTLALIHEGRLPAKQLALQLPFPKISESMGNHDSKIVDAGSVD